MGALPDLTTTVTFLLLCAAAIGAVVIVIEAVRRWYYSPSCKVRFQGAGVSISIPPGKSRLLLLSIENRSHRTMTFDELGIGCPKVLVLEATSIQGGSVRPWSEAQTDPGLPDNAFWSATILENFYLEHGKSVAVGLQFLPPTAPGKYGFDVVIKPLNEAPLFYKLTIDVSAG